MVGKTGIEHMLRSVSPHAPIGVLDGRSEGIERGASEVREHQPKQAAVSLVAGKDDTYQV